MKEFGLKSLEKKLSIKVKENDLADLRELGQKLKMIRRDAFKRKYGNLFSLLEVEVQILTVTTLA